MKKEGRYEVIQVKTKKQLARFNSYEAALSYANSWSVISRYGLVVVKKLKDDNAINQIK